MSLASRAQSELGLGQLEECSPRKTEWVDAIHSDPEHALRALTYEDERLSP
jgi:hypothetical protein